ncbi:hypothetical protein FB451DRAFT_1133691, partial [Mycena latifolia]
MKVGVNLLHRSVALEALYDSADGFPQPQIHPATRQKLLDELWEMAMEPLASLSSGSEIVWVNGPAGAGKSAVMQTLCQHLQQAGRLGGSFFFKRDHSIRASAKVLFATLAYQLALYVPDLKMGISQKVEEDPSVIGRSMGVQLKRLIVEPCLSLKADNPVIIVIDGLDECDGQDAQKEILRVLGKSFHEHHPPLRIFIASRPEPHIREVLQDCRLSTWIRHVDMKGSFADITNYLRTEFARIRSEHETMDAVSGTWPPAEVLRKLVSTSCGFFIYPAMIIKFVDDRNFRPLQRLQLVHMSSRGSHRQFRTPFHALDSVYTQILAGITPQPQLLAILSAILSFNVLSITHLEQVLKLRPGDVRLALRGLHALLDVPPKTDSRSRIGVHHASFLDFLDDPARAGQFYVGGSKHRLAIARAILRALSSVSPVGHVAWSQALRINGISYITSKIPPSLGVDLVSLLQQVNPDFLLYDGSSEAIKNTTGKIVNWLKKIQPEPADLLQFWDEYKSSEDLGQNVPSLPVPISLYINCVSSGDLARRCLHFIRRIGAERPPLHFWEVGLDLEWGRHVRASPPELLHEISEFVPSFHVDWPYFFAPVEFHDVV